MTVVFLKFSKKQHFADFYSLSSLFMRIRLKNRFSTKILIQHSQHKPKITMPCAPTNSDINNLLDSLYLELLHLIEQHTECRVKIERLNNSGQLLLAKTRFNQGSQSITLAQIPTENSEAFKALCYVEEEACDAAVAGRRKHLVRHKSDKTEGYVEPLNWFSVLAPTTLRNAAAQFKKSIELVVEAANIQTEMLTIIDRLDRLKLVKKQLVQ